MTNRAFLHHVMFAAALISASVAAAPIDFTTGIATGVLYDPFPRGEALRDGSEIVLPVQDYILKKSYTAQVVGTGSDEKSEAFVAINGSKDYGFGSAVSDGKGAVEVGAFNNLRDRSLWVAVSRYYTTIKNNTENELEFDFFYVIEPGEMRINGIRSDYTAHARVEATIDYVLLTPDGGSYDETTGQLLKFFADIDFFDSVLTKSPNADVTLYEKNDFVLGYTTEPLSGSVSLPTIPGYGELTFYYDMYALFTSDRYEVGGLARLGDPTDLVGGPGGRLVQTSTGVSQIPEPATFLLLGAGLLAIAAKRRK